MALGFSGARIVNTGSVSGLSEAGMARVRDVLAGRERARADHVDETRERVVSGGLDEQPIRELLMEAVRDPNDPGLRADSVDLLNTRVQSARRPGCASLYPATRSEHRGTVQSHGRSEVVRAGAGSVERAVADSPQRFRPGIRNQAIDLSIQGSGQNVDRQVIGTLQQLMLREENDGVRQRCQRVLASFNASPGDFIEGVRKEIMRSVSLLCRP